MSERIGPIDYGSDNGEVFLGRDLAAGKGYSEVKAAEIDDEIHRIIEHAYHACEKLLSEHMDEMKRVAEYLIRNETMDGETFVKVYNGEIVPDKIVGEDLMTEASKGRRCCMRWDLYIRPRKCRYCGSASPAGAPAGGMVGKRLDGCRRIEEGPQSCQSTRQ